MLKGIDWLIQRNGDAEPFDHIVVECSGVAEPSGVREKFQDAEMEGAMELTECKLHTMVTVVDMANFLRDYKAAEALQDRGESLGEDDHRTVTPECCSEPVRSGLAQG